MRRNDIRTVLFQFWNSPANFEYEYLLYIIHDGSEKNEKICNKAKKGKENDSYMSFWKNLSQV